MKQKLFKLYGKYKLAIIIALTTIIIGLIGIILYLNFSNKSSIKEYKNDNYIVKYDNSWKISSKDSESIVFEHDSESKLSIEIIALEEEYKFSSMEDLIDDLLYDVEKQNKDYKLLYKESTYITKNKYDGYRLLFENDDSQAMVVFAKKSDKLILFTYEAKNEYFDILLDSVQNIIYDFDTIPEKYNLTHELNVDVKSISYGDSKKVEDLLKENTVQEIAANNYYIKYSIPSNFVASSPNTKMGMFSFEGLDEGKMSMTVNLYNYNIYEYLDKDKSLNIYKEYKHYSSDADYSNFTESIDKLESDLDSYIYKCSYNYDKALTYDENFNSSLTSELKDNIILVYALDKNHILLIKIEASKFAIPEKLINMIKIESSTNYSSYTNSTKDNGVIKSILKRKNDAEEITISIPDKYKEIDKKTNLYEERNYSVDYNDELGVYDYDINYTLSSSYSKLENLVNIYNNSITKAYGDYKELTFLEEKTINGKNFYIYDGGYTDLSGIMFTSTNRIKYYVNQKVLFYELSSGGYLTIKISGNNKLISDDLINEVTNFEIKN